MKEEDKLLKSMTAKQRRFCEEYIKSANGTQAAILAGYSESSAKEIASENLTKPNIQQYVKFMQSKIQDKTIADAIEIQRYLTRIIRGEETEEVLQLDGNGFQKLVAKKPSVADRTKAAELMGKRYALFTDNVNAKIEGATVIVDDVE